MGYNAEEKDQIPYFVNLKQALPLTSALAALTIAGPVSAAPLVREKAFDANF